MDRAISTRIYLFGVSPVKIHVSSAQNTKYCPLIHTGWLVGFPPSCVAIMPNMLVAPVALNIALLFYPQTCWLMVRYAKIHSLLFHPQTCWLMVRYGKIPRPKIKHPCRVKCTHRPIHPNFQYHQDPFLGMEIDCFTSDRSQHLIVEDYVPWSMMDSSSFLTRCDGYNG